MLSETDSLNHLSQIFSSDVMRTFMATFEALLMEPENQVSHLSLFYQGLAQCANIGHIRLIYG